MEELSQLKNDLLAERKKIENEEFILFELDEI